MADFAEVRREARREAGWITSQETRSAEARGRCATQARPLRNKLFSLNLQAGPCVPKCHATFRGQTHHRAANPLGSGSPKVAFALHIEPENPFAPPAPLLSFARQDTMLNKHLLLPTTFALASACGTQSTTGPNDDSKSDEVECINGTRVQVEAGTSEELSFEGIGGVDVEARTYWGTKRDFSLRLWKESEGEAEAFESDVSEEPWLGVDSENENTAWILSVDANPDFKTYVEFDICFTDTSGGGGGDDSGYQGPPGGLTDEDANFDLWSEYCIGDKDDVNVSPMPKYANPAVQEAADILSLQAGHSFALYSQYRNQYKATNYDAPNGVTDKAHQFLVYLCGEFRDRATMVEAKIGWIHNTNYLSLDSQDPIEPTERNPFLKMTAESYEPYIQFTRSYYYAKKQALSGKHTFGNISGVDKPVDGMSVCETRYILSEYVDEHKPFPGLQTFQDGYAQFVDDYCTALQPRTWTTTTTSAATATSSQTPPSRTA